MKLMQIVLTLFLLACISSSLDAAPVEYEDEEEGILSDEEKSDDNREVVVFVHGVLGVGPEDKFFFKKMNYWGFNTGDRLKRFRKKYRVFYAKVGPVSSNHDRACELYAQIKGGVVDYGKLHSDKYHYNRTRYGKKYETTKNCHKKNRAFYPQWDGNHPIHFVVHSQGASTLRYLELYLQKGDPVEYQAISGEQDSDKSLFRPNKPTGGNWIKSFHSISGVFEGSTLVEKMGAVFVNYLVNALLLLVTLFNKILPESLIRFDWALEQFNLIQNKSILENFLEYTDRVIRNKIFEPGFDDIVSSDTGVLPMFELNRRSEYAYPNTYYFSYSTFNTYADNEDHSPKEGMTPFLKKFARVLGDIDYVTGYYFNSTESYYEFDHSWEMNDGFVPTRSTISPRFGSKKYTPPLHWTNHPYCNYKMFSVRKAGQNILKEEFLLQCPYVDKDWRRPGGIYNFHSPIAPGLWYNRKYDRDHLQIVGLRIPCTGAPLRPSAGVFRHIFRNLQRITTNKTGPQKDSRLIRDGINYEDEYQTIMKESDDDFYANNINEDDDYISAATARASVLKELQKNSPADEFLILQEGDQLLNA